MLCRRYPRTFSGRRASQSEEELSGFIQFLKERGVTRYLEIGARDGDTFHEIMMNLPAGSFGVAVDLPGGLWGKDTTHHALRRAVEDLDGKGYNAHFILGDSRSHEIVDKIYQCGQFDAALIDGDHTYDGVKADWDNYRDVAPVVAFHDIVGHGESESVHNNPVEVPRLWGELRGKKTEFLAHGSTMGIGVIEEAE